MLQKVQLVMKEVFSNIIPNELAIRRFQICKVGTLLSLKTALYGVRTEPGKPVK